MRGRRCGIDECESVRACVCMKLKSVGGGLVRIGAGCADVVGDENKKREPVKWSCYRAWRILHVGCLARSKRAAWHFQIY